MSAKHGQGVEDVKHWILSKLPFGPAYYPKVLRISCFRFMVTFLSFETKVLDGVPVLWSPMLYSCLIPTIRSQVQKLHEGYECLKIISTIHSFIRVT